MRLVGWLAVVVMLAATTVSSRAGDAPPCESDIAAWLGRVHPVGGWCPYGTGPIHWWNPHCFPCCKGPDDYCRKTLPCVCWPGYPGYFQYGPPNPCACRAGGCQAPSK
jgi:hypothetical protein